MSSCERVNKLEDRSIDIYPVWGTEEKQQWRQRNRDSEICGIPSSISTKRVAQKDRERISEEITAENVSNLMKNTNLHIQESQQNPRSINETYFYTHCSQTVKKKWQRRQRENLESRKRKVTHHKQGY